MIKLQRATISSSQGEIPRNKHSLRQAWISCGGIGILQSYVPYKEGTSYMMFGRPLGPFLLGIGLIMWLFQTFAVSSSSSYNKRYLVKLKSYSINYPCNCQWLVICHLNHLCDCMLSFLLWMPLGYRYTVTIGNNHRILYSLKRVHKIDDLSILPNNLCVI